MKLLFCALAASLLCSCSPWMETRNFKQDARLRDYAGQKFLMMTGGGIVAPTRADSGKAPTGDERDTAGRLVSLPGSPSLLQPETEKEKLVCNAARDIADGLVKLGCTFTVQPEAADVLVRFTPRSLRFDLVLGWITSGASLEFIETERKRPIMTFDTDMMGLAGPLGSCVSAFLEEAKGRQ